MHLDEDLALPVKSGQDVAALVGHGQLHHGVEGSQPVGQRLQEVVDSLPRRRRDRHRPETLQRHQRLGIGHVELVRHQQLGDVAGAELAQHRPDGVDLALRLR